jgi:phosphate transport system permease protein
MAGAAPQLDHFSKRGEYRALPRLKGFRVGEVFVYLFLVFAAVSSILITFGIVFTLVGEAIPFFRNDQVSLFGPDGFFRGSMWAPSFSDPAFGILPLVTGTLVTSFVALAIAIPFGTIIAIWLSEYAPHRVRDIIKPTLELLAAVPTVVYGYFALQSVTPFLQNFFEGLGVALPQFNMLSAGLVMGIMIIPYVSSLSEDAMRSVPMLLREGSYAMGSSKLGTSLKVVFPAALSGIASAYILAISRAVGETMIVAIAAGQQANLTLNPTEGAATITAEIVRASLGDLPHDSIGFQGVFAAGLTLFAMTLIFNMAGSWLRHKYRQAY